jgi:formylglycine-generating enzyme required for sulfatase activity
MLHRDTDRRMDAGIPEREKRRALAGLAYHLGLGQRLSCPREEAVEAVARRLGQGQVEQADQVVGACARHGLLAGDDPVWFAPHHTVQEHFAALALQEEAQQEWQVGRWGRFQQAVRRLRAGHEQGLAGLAADDWWMETFVQLAGLMDDADRLAREVVRVNPWLAWWCVEEGRGVAEETRQAVAERSIRLLESERVADRRRAVAALSQVRSERVVRPLLRAAADPDAEVAGLAVQALVEMGEAVRGAVAEALRTTDQRLRLAALRYLVERPGDPLCQQVPWEQILGQPMAWVPPGPFLMGSDRGRDSQAFDNELPQHQVTLPGYWIGRYPVTVAQFRAFVEASGHKPQDPDSLKGPGDHPVLWVPWYDALAFCRWLSERVGIPVTLPSEAEWEKAARGTDGRVYPWGDEPPDGGRCNFGGNVGSTTPVGRYSPRGDSPYGCADMAGNVWEWTRSLWGEGLAKPNFKYPYDPEDGRENLETGRDARRVLRGGAFNFGGRLVRCAARYWSYPNSRGRLNGFRLVASPVYL